MPFFVNITHGLRLVQLLIMGDNRCVLTRVLKAGLTVNYLVLFAYLSFISALVFLLGGGLYLVDQYLDPVADDAPSGRHAADV